MSQLASAYTLTEVQMSALDQLAAAEDWDSYWKLLRNEAREVTPAYGYSGSIMAMMVCLLGERGIELAPKNKRFSALQKDTYLEHSEAKLAADALLEVDTSDDELEEYYEEFFGEPGDNAAESMWDAIEFLRKGCEKAAETKSYFLLCIG